MFDHVTIRVANRHASEHFYHDFSIMAADGEHPPTRHLHVVFVSPAREDARGAAGRPEGGCNPDQVEFFQAEPF